MSGESLLCLLIPFFRYLAFSDNYKAPISGVFEQRPLCARGLRSVTALAFEVFVQDLFVH